MGSKIDEFCGVCGIKVPRDDNAPSLLSLAVSQCLLLRARQIFELTEGDEVQFALSSGTGLCSRCIQDFSELARFFRLQEEVLKKAGRFYRWKPNKNGVALPYESDLGEKFGGNKNADGGQLRDFMSQNCFVCAAPYGGGFFPVRTHLADHEGQAPLGCLYCPFESYGTVSVFPSLSALLQHTLRDHFKCDQSLFRSESTSSGSLKNKKTALPLDIRMKNVGDHCCFICGKWLKSAQERDIHISSNPETHRRGPFMCVFCPGGKPEEEKFSAKNIEELRLHVAENHFPVPQDELGLWMDDMDEDGAARYSSLLMNGEMKGYPSSKSSKLKDPEIVKRSAVGYHKCCFRCGKRFASPQMKNKHLIEHANDQPPYTCPYCPHETFEELTNLKKHVLEDHFKAFDFEQREGDDQVKEIVSKPELVGDSYKCSVPGCPHPLFPDLESCVGHMQSDHPKTTEMMRRTCGFCGVLFDSFASYKKHECRSEQSRGPFKCRKCPPNLNNVTFKTILKLKEHLVCDHFTCDERVCEKCGKTFMGEARYVVHWRTHVGRNYECRLEGCSNAFTTRNALEAHVKSVHENEFAFVCEDCGKSYKTKFALVVHRRTHNGDFRFTCHLCHEKFNVKVSYDRHMVKHAGTKDHSCDECGKRFAMVRELRAHQARMHLDKRQTLVCNICSASKTFLTRPAFRAHLAKVHNFPKFKINLLLKTGRTRPEDLLEVDEMAEASSPVDFTVPKKPSGKKKKVQEPKEDNNNGLEDDLADLADVLGSHFYSSVEGPSADHYISSFAGGLKSP